MELLAQGRSPLFAAVLSEDTVLTEELLTHGASYNEVERSGDCQSETSLFAAAMIADEAVRNEMIALMKKSSDGELRINPQHQITSNRYTGALGTKLTSMGIEYAGKTGRLFASKTEPKQPTNLTLTGFLLSQIQKDQGLKKVIGLHQYALQLISYLNKIDAQRQEEEMSDSELDAAQIMLLQL